MKISAIQNTQYSGNLNRLEQDFTVNSDMLSKKKNSLTISFNAKKEPGIMSDIASFLQDVWEKLKKMDKGENREETREEFYKRMEQERRDSYL